MRNREGVVTSLADIRFASLRAEHDSLLERVNDLLATAHQNSQRFQVITDLSLALIECENLDQIDAVLQAHIVDKTEADDVVLFVRRHRSETQDCELQHVRFVDVDEEPFNRHVFESQHSFCETCRSIEYATIFNMKPDRALASVAIVPVPDLDNSVALIIGSYDPEHFSVSAGTLFLDYVGNVLSRISRRVLYATPG